MILSRLRKPARTLPRPQACGVKNDVKDISVAKSGTEDVKKDPAAEKAPDASAVDSDKATTDPPTATTDVTPALKKDIPATKSGAEASFDETGVIKNAPALKPVIKKQAAVCGETLPSIKKFPEPAPAASALLLRRAPADPLLDPTPLSIA